MSLPEKKARYSYRYWLVDEEGQAEDVPLQRCPRCGFDLTREDDGVLVGYCSR